MNVTIPYSDYLRSRVRALEQERDDLTFAQQAHKSLAQLAQQKARADQTIRQVSDLLRAYNEKRDNPEAQTDTDIVRDTLKLADEIGIILAQHTGESDAG